MEEESEARNPVEEARDQQRRERLLKADEDYGSGASQQGLEANRRQDDSPDSSRDRPRGFNVFGRPIPAEPNTPSG
jgi:hypothetical protein